jgi:hypothetical protein
LTRCDGRWPERLLQGLYAALLERLGLGVAGLRIVEEGEVVERGGHSGAIGSLRLLVDGEGTLVERLGLGVAALRSVELA